MICINSCVFWFICCLIDLWRRSPIEYGNEDNSPVMLKEWVTELNSPFSFGTWTLNTCWFTMVISLSWTNSLFNPYDIWVDLIKKIVLMVISSEVVLRWMSPGPYWWWTYIGSSNGFVPSGKRPLPEPMLIQICVAILRHYTTMD